MNPVLHQVSPLEPPLREPRGPAPQHPNFHEVGYGYRFGEGFALSVLLHQLVLIVILVFGRYPILRPSIRVKPRQLESSQSSSILLLPTLGGGSEGGGQSGGGHGTAGKISLGLRAQSRRGFAYPGPQPRVSNPPRATLGIQTILQPSLDKLRSLRRYVPLPNIVQPPAVTAKAASKEAPIVVKSGKVSFRNPPETAVAPPELTLPVAAESKLNTLIKFKPQIPARAIPDAVDASDIARVSQDQKGLLVLNAVPPPDVTVKVPHEEARSLFAVSPAEATIIAEPSAGAKAGGQATAAAGSGNRADIRRGDALAEIAAGGDGTQPGLAGSGTGTGGRYGSGQGTGLNSDANGTGNGRGAASGTGLGSGSATGTGTGAGSAPGTGAFPGITIQGGRYGNGNVKGSSGSMLAESVPHRQTSYDMTIVSTGRSGGGLAELGVFQDEKVYTVYLDMRVNDEDPSPSWTLQYAVLQPSAPSGDDSPPRIRGTPTPPYAMLKEVPDFSPALLRKVGHRLIVASAIMNTSGKLEDVIVRQTPEAQLTAPLVEALKQWLFEPAQIDGRPVALKVLLGMRWTPPQ